MSPGELSRNCLESHQILLFDYSQVQHALTMQKIHLRATIAKLGTFFDLYFLADHVTQLFRKNCFRLLVYRKVGCLIACRFVMHSTVQKLFSVSKV